MGLTDLETIPETGAVFTIGRSRFADNIASHFFIRKDPVVSITCGDEHSAVICQTGRLFVFGSNDWGQLGLGHKNHISKPSCVKALKPEKVTHVACGRAHTLICTGAQKIFTCGSDQEGQLGRGTSAIGDSASSPVLVYDSGLAGSKIVQIAAGSHHSLALLSDGGVFAWGSNLEGQLGLSDVSGLVNKPTKVQIPEPVKQISAGYYHSTFLTESGLVYVCGESESGKLGIDVNFSTQVPPKQMQLPSPALHVACGGHHTVILAENGNLYCTGNNSSGQLGLGTNVTEIHTPKLLPRGAVQDETIYRIACGESHTAIVTESGKLFTCGDGRHGKLGLEENENNVHELTLAPRYKDLFVTNVACGGCHTILVGQKRGTNNHTEMEMENMHAEHPHMRGSLPPLKLPVNRRQSDTRDDKINEIIKDRSDETKDATESVSNGQTTMERTPGKIEENVNNNEENVENNIPNPMNNIRDTDNESPAKTSQKSSNEPSKDVSSHDTSNETNNETNTGMVPNEASNRTEESSESKMENGNEEPKPDEGISESKILDTKSNVEEESTTRVVNHEGSNEVETAQSNIQNEVEINNDNNNAENNAEADNKQSTNAVVEPETRKDTSEPNSDNSTVKETSSDKPMSPTTSTPPPKPPRLKPGSGNSSVERTSSMEMESEDAEAKTKAENERIAEKEQETTDANETTKKDETGSRKSTSKSGSSKSVRSRLVAEETIEIDNQNDKEKIIEEEKVHNDITQDDADVVQSPPPKTGKISKIFKTKRTQAIENGAKTTGNVNTKSKSKTCTIL